MISLLNFFKSVKLAVILISYITVTSILATFIPQGRELAFYYSNYSPVISWLIINTQLYNFFYSFLFLAPLSCFFINLAVCMINRLSRELKKKTKKRLGPDLIHLGLLILIISGIITYTGRQEDSTYLGEGDQILLKEEYVLELESFEFLQYDDGSPKDWISTVNIIKNGELIVDSFPIEVNIPLEIGSIKVYQASFAKESTVTLKDSSGQTYTIHSGDAFEVQNSVYYFVDTIENNSGAGEHIAVFEKWQNNEFINTMHIMESQKIVNYTIENIYSRDLTGLQVVDDPGVIPIFISLFIIMFGLFLTYFQKIGEEKI